MAEKKPAPQKTAAGKNPKKPAPKKPAISKEKKALLADLAKIADSLEEESIKFLVAQGQVMLQNKKIQEIRAEQKERTERKPAEPIEGKIGPGRKFKGSDKESIDIVESASGSSFVLLINNYRNFFDRDEMRRIVKICHSADDERDGMSRLHGWFAKNRKDVLTNTDITGSGDRALATMYNAIITTYAVKE
ncbi:MAG TPA: hypothetical protein PKX12_15180 [Spirochaetota bacterium]|nr:hypothetical protein [Spirochaetota bacterium]